MQRPGMGQGAVIHGGADHSQHQTQQAGNHLHRRLAVYAAQLTVFHRHQHKDAEGRAEQAQGKIQGIGTAQVPAGKGEHTGTPFRKYRKQAVPL